MRNGFDRPESLQIMPEHREEHPTKNDHERLQELARRLVQSELEDPHELDELAVLAAAEAHLVRQRGQVARHGYIARIRQTIPNVPDATFEGLSNSTLASVDALLEKAAVEALQHQRLKAEMRQAIEMDAYDNIHSLTDAAQAALRSSDIAIEQARTALTLGHNVHIHGSVPSPLASAAENFDDCGPEVQPPVADIVLLQSNDFITPGAALEMSPEPPIPPPDTFAPGEQTTAQHSAAARELEPTAAPAPGSPSNPAPTARLVWAALSEQRLGLAYALIAAGAFGEATPAIFAPTIRLAAAALIADGSGAIDDEAAATAQAILEVWSNEQAQTDFGHAIVALLLPTLTSLAILAPGAFTTGLLNTLLSAEIDIPALYPLRELASLADSSQAQLGQATGLLASLVSQELWQGAVKQYSNETDAWYRSQNARQFRYAAATDLWRHMLRPEQILGGWLTTIVEGKVGDSSLTSSDLDRFAVEVELRRLEPQVRGRPAARTRRIEGPAFQELRKLGVEALDRVRAWVDLLSRRPHARSLNQEGPIAELRGRLNKEIKAARQTLSYFPPPVDAIAPVVGVMFDRLESLLDAKALPLANERIDERLGREMIACPYIKFSDDWRLVAPIGPSTLPSLIEIATATFPGPTKICADRLQRRDFVGATLALRLVTDEVNAGLLLDTLDKALIGVRERYFVTLDQARMDIETAERAGRLETGQAQELLADIEAVNARLKDARTDHPTNIEACLAEADSLVDATRNTLADAEEKSRQRIKLRQERLTTSDSDRARIEKALENGQFAIAEDLVDRLEAGDPIDSAPPPTVEAIFEAFFPDRNQNLLAWRANNGAVLRDLVKSPLAIPPGQDVVAEDIASCIDAWTDCASEPYQRLARELPRLLMQVVGFTEPELIDAKTPKAGATEAHFRLRTRVLRERGTSVLPEFGSSANGTYSLLCVWKKRNVEDIVEALARQPLGNGPTIVLFFAPLDPIHRQRLAKMARTGRLRSAIVIDELLALHLASLSSGRLTALFSCTLPFTDTQPWAETGTPPPEMFFGRQLELRDIESLDGGGAHLVYGGRQLGKTALLRQVIERNGESPTTTIALYLSIAQLGVSSQVDALWGILAEELSLRGVPISTNGSEPARVFAAAIRAWLAAVPARRIILLLDEADEFFRNDRDSFASFSVTRALSELANQTNRRFKPVFAGLRNVQKVARDPNSPLAHLGTPRVIGPLMRGQEREQAEQLVRWPFAALGYRLSDEVVTRILAFANYYPSLIQVVCQRVLRGLRERQGNGPPWIVTMAQVSAVLEAADLRAAIFERFRITLELDPRYQLLSLVMADLSRNDPHMLATGINGRELREWAAGLWPQGFPSDFSDDAFDALLSEMVGLGLLRDVRGTHVALRSSNLAHLIGSAEKIKADLDGFLYRAAPSEADPAQARRLIKGWPSLFTGQQEGVLTADLRSNRRDAISGCIVVAGLAAANIGTADAAIREIVAAKKKPGAKAELLLSNINHIDATHLRDAIAAREGADRPAIWIIKPEANWTAETVSTAAKLLAAQATRNVPTRVIFVADAARAWDWCGAPERQPLLEAEEPRSRVRELSAGPWSRTALDLWLKDHTDLALPPEDILIRTGGWDRAIYALGNGPKLSRGGPLDSAVLDNLIADLRQLRPAIQVLNALREIVAVGGDEEFVTESTLASWDANLTLEQVKHALAWGQLVGILQPSKSGLELNAFISEALPRLAVL
jgi:hypothetical protein